MKPPVITLLTDFGTRDHYVAVVKGVILRIAPHVQVLDVTHDLAPHDIRSAAVILSEISDAFPEGTVHLAVVDPGVGSGRAILAGRWGSQRVVAPDNGLVTLLQRRKPAEELHHVTRRDLALAEVSQTFHGRDIMAPVAAHLASGMGLAEVGPAVAAPVMLSFANARRAQGALIGEVLYIDRFGNLLTNITAVDFKALLRPQVLVCGQIINGAVTSYAEGPLDRPVALISSMDTLEIALNRGSAAALLHAAVGDLVRCVESEAQSPPGAGA